MKRIFFICLLIMLGISAVAANDTVSGRVMCGKKGVKGVVVSDGFTTAVTGKNGKYYLESEKKLGYVFISVPSGYKVATEGSLPQFYQHTTAPADEWETIDFSLEEDPGQEEHTMICAGDLHLAAFHDDHRQYLEWVDDLNAFIAEKSDGHTYVMTLGDMTWDVYWRSNKYNVADFREDVKLIQGAPVFPVIGNHDHELEAKGEKNASKKFRSFIGPTYYSFNIGNVHYVALDSVDSRNDGQGSRVYKCRVNPAQLSWLEQDLSYVDKSVQVVVASHIPLGTIEEHEKLLALFAKFEKPVHFVTAHIHSVKNSDHLADAVPYYDHTVGCPAGSLWMTGWCSPGIEISKDGAPAGYTVFSISSDGLSWQYKSTGHPLDYQFRAYDGNMICLDPAVYVPEASQQNLDTYMSIAQEWVQPSDENYVYINVWNKDNDWKIQVFEDGQKLKVEKVAVHDPLHIISYPAKVLNSKEDPGKITQLTGRSNHFVRVRASRPDSALEIKVTDRFGKVYTGTMERPKVFSVDNYLNR